MNTDWYYSARPHFAAKVLRAFSKERWSFAITFTLLLGAAVAVIRILPRTYEAQGKILIEYPRSTAELSGVNAQAGVGEIKAVGERVNPINNQVALLRSRPIFEQALARLQLSPDQAPYPNLEVSSVGGTDVIQVIYSSESPILAAQVTEAIIEIYREINLQNNREKAATARKFLESRLPQIQVEMNNAKEALKQFQESNRFLGTATELETFTKALNELEMQAKQAQRELAFTESKIARLKTQLPPNLTTAVDAAGLSQDQGYQTIQSQLLEAEAKLAQLRSRFTEDSPAVQNALDNRNQLKALLDMRSRNLSSQQRATNTPVDPIRQRLIEQWYQLETERSAQAARASQLSEQLRQMQNRLGQLPQLIKQQQQLQLGAQTTEKEYITFKEKYITSQIAEEQNISNVRVVEPVAIPGSPAWPNRKLLYALALVVSAGVASGLVWWRTSQSDSLNTIAELKEILPLPVLAVIPWSGNGRLSSDESMDEPALVKSYRLLQAHLQMLPRNMQVMAVCSWGPAEGRSCVAANLALLEAQSGRRVLLIEADGGASGQPELGEFRFTQHHSPKSWNGKKSDKAVLKKLLNFDRLSGNETPSTYLSKEWIGLLEQVRKQYDLIILDCPPTVAGPDATVLAAMSDGVLWVTCPQRLGRRGAETAAESLRTWTTRLLGQVIIDADGKPLPPPSRDTHFNPPKLTDRLPSGLLGGERR